MTAPDSTIGDIRARTHDRYWNAKLWLAVLSQDQRWIPRGAWGEYASASLRGVATQQVVGVDPGGNDLTVGEVRRAIYVDPQLDVEGSLAISDMDLRYRQTVCGFLWKRSRAICTLLSYGAFHVVDPFGDMPDEAADALIEEDIRWMGRSRDEQARRTWFEGTPLIAKLRSSVVAERESRIPRPVLLVPPPRVAEVDRLHANR